MDFTPLEKDMNIISALDDEPNDVGGLTSTELKAKFDEGGNAIKDYLNNTVIPEVKAALGDKAGKDELQGLVLGQIPDGTITEDKLSEELKEQIGSMAPASDVFTKEETLRPETAAMYGLSGEEAVPDGAFKKTFLPVGTIMWYSATTAPAGFLVCDGSLISRADYAALFAVIGTAFGAGDGSTTFALPNLQAAFVRGAGSQDGYSATFGQKQEATRFPELKAVPTSIFDYYSDKSTSINSQSIQNFGSNNVNVYAVRPYNIALTPIIKY